MAKCWRCGNEFSDRVYYVIMCNHCADVQEIQDAQNKWPYTKEIVDAMSSEGIHTWFILDTDWGKNIQYFKQLPLLPLLLSITNRGHEHAKILHRALEKTTYVKSNIEKAEESRSWFSKAYDYIVDGFAGANGHGGEDWGPPATRENQRGHKRNWDSSTAMGNCKSALKGFEKAEELINHGGSIANIGYKYANPDSQACTYEILCCLGSAVSETLLCQYYLEKYYGFPVNQALENLKQEIEGIRGGPGEWAKIDPGEGAKEALEHSKQEIEGLQGPRE